MYTDVIVDSMMWQTSTENNTGHFLPTEVADSWLTYSLVTMNHYGNALIQKWTELNGV